jgi:hypothetical protein
MATVTRIPLSGSGRARSCCGPARASPATSTSIWAVSTALGLPEGEVFECQVVPYLCARRFAPALLRIGEAEYNRLRRFWEAPVRAVEEPSPVVLPGSGLQD